MIKFNHLILGVLLLVICFFTFITESVAETMTPDPDLPEGWEFQFNAPFGQIDDITPIPGPFQPYQMDAYYFIIQTATFANLVGTHSDNRQITRYACLALDTKKGEAVLKFLFDRTFYMLDVKKISSQVFELSYKGDRRKIKLFKISPESKDRSDYRLRFADGFTGGDDFYSKGAYAATSDTYLFPTMSACINKAVKMSLK
ncbi:hypothetical protein [Leptospira kanakyensis]|uniref:Uncharacterized protein n=1 Tax=Leptospira kanakyensis TaxID=2484968 RepID=A0A6N4PSV6_9LEPT|nr:hypothetical protein [Leptospira kanakyensis]MCW7480881.1 hypothetical protein [Leptospira kanakyensis]TGK47680.1 hypothetical protein EHQ11_17300 [Leptospira kanakyensis]TGK63317.1 hypothetical protein EHQ16_02330 [Leptospira kanakyensis]TGK66924.1 hypothetical protein EHQ18_17565 [Leptospira kanakyensis]